VLQMQDSNLENNSFSFAVLTSSDRCSKGECRDESGSHIVDIIKEIGGQLAKQVIVPDEEEIIKENLVAFCDDLKVNIVFTTGGTGLGPRDITPEATKRIADKLIPGISELMRYEGLKSTKKAMLSRGVSALRGKTLIINLPGSPNGVKESLNSIVDIIPHALDMVKGKGH